MLFPNMHLPISVNISKIFSVKRFFGYFSKNNEKIWKKFDSTKNFILYFLLLNISFIIFKNISKLFPFNNCGWIMNISAMGNRSGITPMLANFFWKHWYLWGLIFPTYFIFKRPIIFSTILFSSSRQLRGVKQNTRLFINFLSASFSTLPLGSFLVIFLIKIVLLLGFSFPTESKSLSIFKKFSIFFFFHNPSLYWLNSFKNWLAFTPGYPYSFWDKNEIELTSP